jgi:inorganic pyrophosphatase
MIIDNLPVGKDVPNSVNVIIEIPAQASPVKYEVDKETGALMVDRFMSAPMFYPANYGFVPHTLAEDGDPADVLVVTPHPLVHGCVIPARPIGILKMSDEAGGDSKIIAVPAGKLAPQYKDVTSYEQLPELLLQQIKHFFERYKELEPGKWVKVEGWGNADDAKAEILASIKRFQDSKA